MSIGSFLFPQLLFDFFTSGRIAEQSLRYYCSGFVVIGSGVVFWVFIIHLSPERKKGKKILRRVFS
jgi:uncharacterized protein YjeT (DUF2065 family)